MESSAAGPTKEKKGLGKLWKKAKAAIKKLKSTSSNEPGSSTVAAVPATAPSEPAPVQAVASPAVAEQNPTGDVPRPITPDSHVEDVIIPRDSSTKPVPVEVEQAVLASGQPDEAKVRFNKAQAIFARYNMELNEADWDMRPKEPYERVAKNIRMRVRYTCHNCSTTFGHDKTCLGCQHRRCKECARYPAKKDKSRTKTSNAAGIAPTSEGLPSSSEATCHECQTGFGAESQECPNCHHQICDRCVKEATITVENPSSSQALTEVPAAPS